VAVTAALRRLPEAQRRVVVLHYLYGLTVAQIATSTQMPPGTVKVYLARARVALARLLGDDERGAPMSSRIHDGIADLGRDVAALSVPSAGAIRARGEARRRRRIVVGVTTAVAGVALARVVTVPFFAPDGPLGPGPGGPSNSGCAPFALPTAVPSGASLRVAAYLTSDATALQQAAIAAELESMPEVAYFAFEDHVLAYQRFSDIYCAVPGLLATTKPESLPESFQITLRYPGDASTVAERLRTMPGVDTVVSLPE
jgi:hypothetical protein